MTTYTKITQLTPSATFADVEKAIDTICDYWQLNGEDAEIYAKYSVEDRRREPSMSPKYGEIYDFLPALDEDCKWVMKASKITNPDWEDNFEEYDGIGGIDMTSVVKLIDEYNKSTIHL